MAALVAYLVGLPLLRLGSDYFGIATLGFAIMVYTALQNSDLVIATMKGARGMVGIPLWTTWPWVFGTLVGAGHRDAQPDPLQPWARHHLGARGRDRGASRWASTLRSSRPWPLPLAAFSPAWPAGCMRTCIGFLHPSTFYMIKGFDPLIIIVFGGLGSMTGTIVASVAVCAGDRGTARRLAAGL